MCSALFIDTFCSKKKELLIHTPSRETKAREARWPMSQIQKIMLTSQPVSRVPPSRFPCSVRLYVKTASSSSRSVRARSSRCLHQRRASTATPKFTWSASTSSRRESMKIYARPLTIWWCPRWCAKSTWYVA